MNRAGPAGSGGQGDCATCGAFMRKGEMPGVGVVGRCAKEVYAFPVAATATCPQYRRRGAPPPPAPAPRASRAAPVVPAAARRQRTLPTEINLDMDADTFRLVLTQVLREEFGPAEADLGGKWQGGELVLKPGREGVSEKRIPIETFFHKIVMLRDKLRVLEQRLNAHAGLSDEEKVALQQYVTACYGTLTTFNALFADAKQDGFKGGAPTSLSASAESGLDSL